MRPRNLCLCWDLESARLGCKPVNLAKKVRTVPLAHQNPVWDYEIAKSLIQNTLTELERREHVRIAVLYGEP